MLFAPKGHWDVTAKNTEQVDSDLPTYRNPRKQGNQDLVPVHQEDILLQGPFGSHMSHLQDPLDGYNALLGNAGQGVGLSGHCESSSYKMRVSF